MNDYLDMQKHHYENEATLWSRFNRDPVVGSYDAHNVWTDYDNYLFKGFDTKGKIALEYGCGPGRNLIRFKNRFARIDGVDIATNNLKKAVENISANGITDYNLYTCDGKSIPIGNDIYDVVFSVICLQHIASHSIRFQIMKEIYRVLKPDGYFCFQMGFGGKDAGYVTCGYYDDAFDAQGTNSAHDTVVMSTEQLSNDLEKIGFKNYQFDIRPTGPGDSHKNWIWVQVKKE